MLNLLHGVLQKIGVVLVTIGLAISGLVSHQPNVPLIATSTTISSSSLVIVATTSISNISSSEEKNLRTATGSEIKSLYLPQESSEEIKANQENSILEQDKLPYISPQDDDEIHLYAHYLAKKTAATWAHIFAHEQQWWGKKISGNLPMSAECDKDVRQSQLQVNHRACPIIPLGDLSSLPTSLQQEMKQAYYNNFVNNLNPQFSNITDQNLMWSSIWQPIEESYVATQKIQQELILQQLQLLQGQINTYNATQNTGSIVNQLTQQEQIYDQALDSEIQRLRNQVGSSATQSWIYSTAIQNLERSGIYPPLVGSYAPTYSGNITCDPLLGSGGSYRCSGEGRNMEITPLPHGGFQIQNW